MRFNMERKVIFNKVITTSQLCKMIDVPKRTLLGWIKAGTFLKPELDVRGHFFWPKSEIEEYIASRSFVYKKRPRVKKEINDADQ